MPQTVVITGGSSGIGAETAAIFAASGCSTVIVDRNEPAVGGEFVRCDLSREESINVAVEQLPAKIDVLVNAAGVSGLAPVETVMKVNFFGLRKLTEEVADRINEGGSVINVASTSSWYWRQHLGDIGRVLETRTDSQINLLCAELIPDGYAAYERSKEAVLVWTTVAAQRYLGKFRVNSVSPGPIQTPLLADFYEAMGHEELDPLTARSGGRNGKPEEIARVIAFLAAEESFWINGTDIPVDHSAEMSEFLAAQGIIPPLEGATT